jgi:hypothetical protein
MSGLGCVPADTVVAAGDNPVVVVREARGAFCAHAGREIETKANREALTDSM